MRTNCLFELSLILDSEKFYKLLKKAEYATEYSASDDYVDASLAQKGIMVIYRDSQYKKKVKLMVEPKWILGSNDDPGTLPHKLDSYIRNYFHSRYTLDDFTLTGMSAIVDMDLDSPEGVGAYIKALQRIGKVKGFSPASYEHIDDRFGFYLNGNSNGIVFMLYDLQKKSKGSLRVEVQLRKIRAIQNYTDARSTAKRITTLLEKNKEIFLDIFVHIIPFGDFHKKEKAIEIIQKNISDMRLRRRMLRLMALIPEKKSLLLAQKALNYRHVDDVMEAFAAINLSPVTLSKRHDAKHLENLYMYLEL